MSPCLLAPQSGAYYDVWMDGELAMTVEKPEVTACRMDNRFGTNFEGSPEPIYGTQFLPRKFKAGAYTRPQFSSSVHRMTQLNSWMCPGVAQVELWRGRV